MELYRHSLPPGERPSLFHTEREFKERVARVRETLARQSRERGYRVSRPARRAQGSTAMQVSAPVAVERGTRGSPGVLAGYAAMYDKPSVWLGFIEYLAPGAFRSTLDKVKAGKHSVLMLTEHTGTNILGRTGANLTLSEDNVGLRFQVELPDTQLGHDVRELVRIGVLRGMSFSFNAKKITYPQTGQRRVEDLTAYEISVVGNPAYPSTSVVVARSIPDDVTWQAARLKALSARSTEQADRAPVRATGRAGLEWR
jgi:hypothetical protein